MKERITLYNVYNYIVGNVRYYMYYNTFLKKYLPKHIIEQYEFRLKVMNKVCYNTGSCVNCGCITTKLQMADKGCKDCYPPLLKAKCWNKFKRGLRVQYNNNEYHLRETSKYIHIYKNNKKINSICLKRG